MTEQPQDHRDQLSARLFPNFKFWVFRVPAFFVFGTALTGVLAILVLSGVIYDSDVAGFGVAIMMAGLSPVGLATAIWLINRSGLWVRIPDSVRSMPWRIASVTVLVLFCGLAFVLASQVGTAATAIGAMAILLSEFTAGAAFSGMGQIAKSPDRPR